MVTGPARRDTARAMSQENVDLVLRGIEALNRRDIEAALTPFHADLKFRDAGTGRAEPDRERFAEMLAVWFDSFAEYREIPEDVFDLGDQVVVLIRAVGRGRASGVTIDERHAEIHEFRDGLVARLTSYPTHHAALEAAGLQE
jgi:ketosteroid isomerase-like protein